MRQLFKFRVGQTLNDIIPKQYAKQRMLLFSRSVSLSYRPEPLDIICVMGRLLGGARPTRRSRKFRVGCWNMNGGLMTDAMRVLLLGWIQQHQFDFFFLLETNFDAEKYNKPFGCFAASGVTYDSNDHPHYGTALFLGNQSLAREVSLVHIDDSMLSVCYQGYVISGVYRKHGQDILHLSNKLTQFGNMPHIAVGDYNFNMFNPTVDRLNEIPYSHHINEIGLVPLEKDSPFTRYATASGHRDSDIDHALVPRELVNRCSSITTLPFNPAFSDHCVLYFDIELDETAPRIMTAKYRLKAFELPEKQEAYAGMSNAKLLSADLENVVEEIRTRQECEDFVITLQKTLQVSLNETVGKHSPKTCRFHNFPSLLQTTAVTSMTFAELSTIAKNHKIGGIAAWRERLKSLTPTRQLKWLKSKMMRRNRAPPGKLFPLKINEYSDIICRPMNKHANLTKEEIDAEFNKYHEQRDCPEIDKNKLIEIVNHLPIRKAYPSKKIPNEAPKYGGIVLINILASLFKTMYKYGLVPKSFGEADVTPIPKKKAVRRN